MTLQEQTTEVKRVISALFAIEETLPYGDGSDLAELRHEIYCTRVIAASFERRIAGRLSRKEPQ